MLGSEDGTACIWNITENKLLCQLDHNKGKCEVLRAALVKRTTDNIEYICTCGADGNAIVWSYNIVTMQAKKIQIFPHQSIESDNETEVVGAQIYACEVINIVTGIFITAADNILRVWHIIDTINNTNNDRWRWKFATKITNRRKK